MFNKLFKRALLAFNRLTSPISDVIEIPFERRIQDIKFAPIFIIGPARSGTTLVYQCITQGLKTSYFPNFATWLPNFPIFAASVASSFDVSCPLECFESNYGKTKGWLAPAQGYEIWTRWFQNINDYSAPTNFDDAAIFKIRKVVASFEKLFDAPFVNKWPGFNVFMAKLSNTFPNAMFVRVHRDYLQIAQSVLKGRLDLYDNPYKSFTRLPTSYRRFQDKHYIDQICAYVLGIEADLNRSQLAIGTDKFYHINYDDLCRYPHGIILDFANWYSENTGYLLTKRGNIQDSFKVSTKQKVDDRDYEALKVCMAKMEGLNF